MGHKFTFRQFARYTLKALPALFTPVILLGGIYSGIVTATEAGVLAAFYAIIISVFAYRALSLKGLIKAIKDTIVQTGIIITIVLGAYVMSYIITSSGVAKDITDWFLGITTNKYVFLAIVNILFLILGMFLDGSVIQFVFLPLILPIVKALGIDLVHFGVVITVNIMLGMCSPPYGLLSFAISGLTGEPLKNVFKEVTPMVVLMVLVLLLITYFPVLTTLPVTLLS